jgi:integrase
MKITKQNLPAIAAAFTASAKADRIFFDDDLPGFGIRFRQGSKRQSYVVQYERAGYQKRIALGHTGNLNPDEARKLAKAELAKVTLGGDPQGEKAKEKARAKITLKVIAEQYLEMKKDDLRPASLHEVRRYLMETWQPLHRIPVHQIELHQVADRLDVIAKHKPTTAARARSALSALLAWAIRRGRLDRNVASLSEKPKEPPSRNRVLSDDELCAVWNACADTGEYSRIIKLLILTGARRDEVGSMQWGELDNGIWTIPAERSKNRQQHVLTLPLVAQQIIGPKPDRGGYVFGRQGSGYTNWHLSKQALDKRSGVTGWTLHDLRRSAATGMANLGIEPHIIEAVLNHISGHKAGVAGIYNRSSYEREVRSALATWADHITSITQRTERRIISFPHERGSGPAASLATQAGAPSARTR